MVAVRSLSRYSNFMIHKKYLIILILAAVALGGCLHTNSTSPTRTDLENINETLVGTLGPANPAGEYALQTSMGTVLVHDGNAVLSAYVGKQIQVTGQYSGTTLYVDKVELVQ